MPRISQIAQVADTIPTAEITERILSEAQRLAEATASRCFQDQVFASVMLLILASRHLRECLDVALTSEKTY